MGTRNLKPIVRLAYFCSLVTFFYQFICWSFDIPGLTSHGSLIFGTENSTQLLTRNQLTLLTLSQCLPHLLMVVSIAYGSRFVLGLYHVFSVYDLVGRILPFNAPQVNAFVRAIFPAFAGVEKMFPNISWHSGNFLPSVEEKMLFALLGVNVITTLGALLQVSLSKGDKSQNLSGLPLSNEKKVLERSSSSMSNSNLISADNSNNSTGQQLSKKAQKRQAKKQAIGALSE